MADLTDMSFTYPDSFENHKKITLILAKFELGHRPANIYSNNRQETLSFRKSTFQSKYKSYAASDSITLKKDNIPFCTVNIYENHCVEVKYVGAKVVVSNSLKEQLVPFLDHPRGHECTFTLRGRAKCGFKEDIGKLSNADSFIRNIKFFEYELEHTLPLLAGISTFNQNYNYDRITFNINQFGKLRSTIGILENLQKPAEDSLNRLIRNLIYMKKENVKDIRVGPISIGRDWTTDGDIIVIKIGGISIVKEFSFERFKYMFHPGLNLIAYYLEQCNKLTHFELAIQKEIFRKI